MSPLTIHPSWFSEPDFSDYDYSQDEEDERLEAVWEEDEAKPREETLTDRLDRLKYF